MAHGSRPGTWATRHARAGLIAAACALVALCATTAAGAARPAWTGAAELGLAANAHPDAPDAIVSSVACAAAGSCAAVGSYTDDANVGRVMVAD
jgi:hypothetical protein